MRRIVTWLAALALASGAAAPVAFAQPAAAVSPADQQTVATAREALNTGGYGALSKHVAGLRAIVGRTPEGLAPNSPDAATYGGAATLLMMLANELKRYDEAVHYGDLALRLRPEDDAVATETALAYSSLKRPDEGLRILDAWMARGVKVDTLSRARVLRARGFMLIELNRLDEAQAAYQAALKLEPDHRGAMNELTYIARLKAGRPPTGSVTTTYGKAKSGDYDGARDP